MADVLAVHRVLDQALQGQGLQAVALVEDPVPDPADLDVQVIVNQVVLAAFLVVAPKE